ncbi:hypothetical protein DSM43518_04777 [Mycobacterium marinum]|uniref:Phage protein Gp19/Gp15/Gp42 n=2 Tax=Mycobacterium marinum TaxID=1781 RepID=B2HPF4_MYCMM|nr:hypothetical protein [Mycobacterium marinum]ACC42306.1 hypothetical protein MMAR_3894 [Mycobacterium marinum M]AXN43465.1 hypothetical protein MM1218R_01517 [Mycobacterium marinum]AXN51235.1 hypothetical protein CCUG20998_03839 [Mycobacterium marinum]RFZ02790.1 hypothetical protein DSM43518_04777 [Mycobacterium marinum]RFZ11483.1 hypothetical protein DE4381_01071 [Mycobacterium marinum]
MTEGKFAARADVTGRFEGTIPANRLDWVDTYIGDVETELMYQVPSLRKSIEEITAESVAAGDSDRINRVKGLVARKVLELFRNPDGSSQLSRTTPDITVSRTWSPDTTRGRVEFSTAELAKVRLRKKRQKFGTIRVVPGLISK